MGFSNDDLSRYGWCLRLRMRVDVGTGHEGEECWWCWQCRWKL